MTHNSILWSRPARVSLAALVALLVVGLTAYLAGASVGQPDSPAPEAESPTLISYQGFVTVSGTAYNGTGYFKFAIVNSATDDGTTNYWANDGTASGEPAASVALPVSNGLFDVLLGDTSLPGMTEPIAHAVFDPTATYLRVWFRQADSVDYQELNPNQRIGSAAYALRSQRAESAAAADAVPWSGITAMPSDFADNVDNDTIYTAGSNLTLTGNSFALDPNPSLTSLTASAEVRLGSSGAACDASSAGSLRYSSLAIEFCNGTAWQALQVARPISFFAYPSSDDWIASPGGWTALTFDSELYDDGNQLSGDAYTIPAADTGVYHFSCHVSYMNAGLMVGLSKNGQVFVADLYHSTSASASRHVEATVKVSPGDVFRCMYWADSGTYLRGTSGTIRLTWFTGFRLY